MRFVDLGIALERLAGERVEHRLGGDEEPLVDEGLGVLPANPRGWTNDEPQ